MSQPTEQPTATAERPLAVDTERAAELIGFSPRTLVEWRKRHVGPHYVQVGQKRARVVYRVEALDEFLRSLEVDTESLRRQPTSEGSWR